MKGWSFPFEGRTPPELEFDIEINLDALLVTSAAVANGNGYGTLLAFDLNGRPLGAFSGDSRIADPRGLAVDRDEALLFLNRGADRVLALDPDGESFVAATPSKD